MHSIPYLFPYHVKTVESFDRLFRLSEFQVLCNLGSMGTVEA